MGSYRHYSLEELIGLLDLEQIEDNLYRGFHPKDRKRRLFGGQIIGQSLIAASRTVEIEKIPHSLHAYFIRPGDWKIPVLFEVERIRNGRSFSTRRVLAVQDGEAILSMDISFQLFEDGLQHQYREAPSFEPPDKAAMAEGLKQRPFLSFREDHKKKMEPHPQLPEQHIWIKANGAVPENHIIHMALLAYQSDEALLSTARLPHRGSYVSEKLQGASLDHSIWFHRPVNVEGWLMYAMDSPATGNARGYTRGEIYDENGLLIASCIQEGLMRMQ
ncbi:MAG: acyl-CoA thioesterase II [Gammaproteobacteria bacterium]|nr:acyl-CoA thioesterase II [Gammaproteobacteria bacterium]